MPGHRLLLILADLDGPLFDGIGAEFDRIDHLEELPTSILAGAPDVSRLLDALSEHRTGRFIPRTYVEPADIRRRETALAASKRHREAAPQASLADHWTVETQGLSRDDRLGLQAELRAQRIVVTCVAEPWLSEPFVDSSDEYFSKQGYLKAAPTGINAQAAWAAGFAGELTQLADVERGWFRNHQDLPWATGRLSTIPYLNGVDVLAGVPHGTAAVGIVAAVEGPDNGSKSSGITGIAPRIKQVFLSSRGHDPMAIEPPDLAGAIWAAMDELRKGDVLLLEVQIPWKLGSGVTGGLPIEIFAPFRKLLQLATQSFGVAVVEAAGNGAMNLDEASQDQAVKGFLTSGADDWGNYSQWWQFIATGQFPASELAWAVADLNPNSDEFEDTGAIMVAACVPPDSNDPDPAGNHAITIGAEYAYGGLDPKKGKEVEKYDWGTNYGSRIDCYAWGSHVWTTSTDHTIDAQDPPKGQRYTWNFDGTSAASAIIAGVAVLVQDMHRTYRGGPAGPEQLRKILRDPDTSTGHVGTRAIGVMPDLGQIHNAMQCRISMGFVQFLHCMIRQIRARLKRLLSELFDWW